jgi:hypothetical protein
MQDLPPLFPTSVPHDTDSTVGGCGGFFLINMFDDNDLFACAAEQQQSDSEPTTIRRRSDVKPLPLTIIRESLKIDETSPSGLRWMTRPRSHFKSDRAWKKTNTEFAGKAAGVQLKNPVYFHIKINNVQYMGHRIIYFLKNDIDPADKQIDHIDPAIPMPNVASNLRLATPTENSRNRKKRSNNTSGVPGVHWDRKAMKWRAYITINQKRIWFGYFAKTADAIAARKDAEVKHFGEFSHDASRKIIDVTNHQ